MILTLTFNPAIDHTYVLDEALDHGKISRTDVSRFDAGGKGINVATYVNALGQEAVATGILGGFTGQFIRKELDRQGLEHDFIESGRTRVNTTILADGEEYKINHDGESATAEAVEKLVDKINRKEAETVVISGSLPPGLNHEAVRKVRENVDAEVAVDLHGDVLGKLEGDYLVAKPNRDELSEATGVDVDSVEKAVEASQILLDKGFENVLASLGAEGAVLVTPNESHRVKGIETEVADTTGAGDALLSGFIAALKEKNDSLEALRKGLAFATLVVETSGTRPPEMQKMEDYVDRTTVERL